MYSKKRVVLSGYYGFDNIGDEAVLLSIIHALREQMPAIGITVLSNNPAETMKTYGVEAVNRWKIPAVAKAIKEADMLISGGGSLLQDTTSNKTIPYYLGIMQIAKWYKKPVVCYSQGIGPINKSYNQKLTQWVLNKVNHIFVREDGSLHTLQRIGVKTPITVAIDPVLGIAANKEIADKLVPIKEKSVGIYIRPWSAMEHTLEELEKVGTLLIEKGYTLYGIPMHGEEDLQVTKQLKEKLRGQLVLVKERSLSIEEVVAYTEQFDLIIGMRLHSLIMAAAVNTPMIALAYDPKVKDFMAQLAIPYVVDVNTFTAEQVVSFVEQMETDYVGETSRLAASYAGQREKVTLPTKFIKSLLR